MQAVVRKKLFYNNQYIQDLPHKIFYYHKGNKLYTFTPDKKPKYILVISSGGGVFDTEKFAKSVCFKQVSLKNLYIFTQFFISRKPTLNSYVYTLPAKSKLSFVWNNNYVYNDSNHRAESIKCIALCEPGLQVYATGRTN